MLPPQICTAPINYVFNQWALSHIDNWAVGVYGDLDVVLAIAGATSPLATYAYQTYACSDGSVWGMNNLYQYQNGVNWAGYNCDADTSSGDGGGWTL